MRTIMLAAVLAAFSFVAQAAVIQPGQILPIRFFCTNPEPLLDMLALDKPGQLEAVNARFAQAQADGACFVMPSVMPGRAVEFLAEGDTDSSGPVEIWAIELPGAPELVFGGFRSEQMIPGVVS